MQIDIEVNQRLANVGRATVNLMTENGIMAKAAEQSPLQKAYREFFMKKLGESDFAKHPFEGTEEQAAEFFREISREWKKRKAELEAE